MRARSNNSHRLSRRRSHSAISSSKDLFETNGGECIKPLEPGTCKGVKSKYKFSGGACLLVDDSKPTVGKEVSIANKKAKQHMLK